MALSTGQISDAFQQALGRPPTGQELQQYSNANLEGSPGQQQLIQQLGGKTSSGATTNFNPTSFSNVSDPLKTAQQIQQFTVQANQPAISQLQSNIDPLKKRYDDIIASIKGVGTVASNYAQQGASMDLGRRGLLPQSQEGQTAIGNALLPSQTQTQTALSTTGLAEQQDINTINNAIAALQTGQPSAAITSAIQALQANYPQIGYGGALYNVNSGSVINPSGNFQLTTNDNTNTGNTNTGNTNTTKTPSETLSNLGAKFGIGVTTPSNNSIASLANSIYSQFYPGTTSGQRSSNALSFTL